jgi:putative flippase GtrA
MAIAFFLMRAYVFKPSRESLRGQVGAFIAVNVLGILQTILISLCLAQWLLPSLGMVYGTEAFSHFIAVLVPLVTSYFGHKLLTFR